MIFNFNQFNESKEDLQLDDILEKNESLKYKDDIIHLFEEWGDLGCEIEISDGYAILNGTKVVSYYNAKDYDGTIDQYLSYNNLKGELTYYRDKGYYRLVECLFIDKVYKGGGGNSLYFRNLQGELRESLDNVLSRIGNLSDDLTIVYDGSDTIDILFT